MKLKSFLSRTGITQTDLANQLGTFQSTVSSWAVHRTEPSMAQMKKLLLMGMTLEEMFDAETEAAVLWNGSNKSQLSEDIALTGIAKLLGIENEKIHDPETCVQIVETAFKHLFNNRK